jgi:hypothetical protein
MQPPPPEPPCQALLDCLEEIEECETAIKNLQYQPGAQAAALVRFWKGRRERAKAKFEELRKSPSPQPKGG